MRQMLVWIGCAVLAALAVPVVYVGAATYGAESLVWDAMHSTYTYVERPGGFIVLTGGMLLCALLVLLSVGAALMAALSRSRWSRSLRRGARAA